LLLTDTFPENHGRVSVKSKNYFNTNGYIIKDMKSQIRIIGLVVTSMLIIAFSACEKDRDPKLNSHFVYDGQTIETPVGYKFLMERDGKTKEIAFLTKGLCFKTIKEGEDVLGSAVLIYELKNVESGELVEGTYPIKEGSASVVINSNFSKKNSNFNLFKCESGELVVKRNGDEYSIDYTIKLENNKTISGRYFGKLERIVE
jgi:hypothetical protein